ncbi:MAG: MBL fold metallo-hydrolase [Sulfobacillus acidophilus]|uniref:MBL fold metallo-hydrolase n=1 Tax=Sulfobacillus acidophilus TaxID=53633 RepID=A0A2T2WIF9_9FIRM|nr:MAG: MBL fold metallo-hydrolase [Sulfobacillus acidophilus]
MRVADRVVVHVLVDNTTDFLSRTVPHVDSELKVLGNAGIQRLDGQDLCSAHHGISLLVTVDAGNRQRTILFDAGPDGYAIRRNGPLMGVKFGEIEALVLSHGHFDHSQGFPDAIQLIRNEQNQQSLPFYVHPGAFVRRGFRLPNGSVLPYQEVPSAETLAQLGVDVRAESTPREVLDGFAYLSGEVPRTSGFERGMLNHVTETAPGTWADDPWIMDDQFMVTHVRNKGLIIFTGCGHAGVVNILAETRRAFPNEPIFGLIGGFHLTFPNEDLIPQTVDALRDFGLSAIAPGHCTGWRAVHALLASFGENIVQPLAVGSRHVF